MEVRTQYMQQQPATKLFDLSDVRRCPVTLSEEAQAYINASHHQGRMFPQVLSEHFGTIEMVESIRIDLAPMSLHHPFHEDGEGSVLIIIVKHRYTDKKEHRFHINASMLRQYHEKTLMPTVQARHIGQEMKRLYPHTAVEVEEVG